MVPPKRYFAQARWDSDLGEDVADPAPMTVFEPDDASVWTGLYDDKGNRIYSVLERDPIGFKP